MSSTQLSSIASVSARKVIRKMRGGAQSYLIECDDNHYYIVKFYGNPQGANVLANELLGSVLASSVGLPVAVPALVSVSATFLAENPQLDFSTAQGQAFPESGIHFGSRLVGETSGPYRPIPYLGHFQVSRVVNCSAFLGMYLFDLWTRHQDRRQALLLPSRGSFSFDVVFIDNGHLFGGPDWTCRETFYLYRNLPLRLYDPSWSNRDVSSWTEIFRKEVPRVLPSVVPLVPKHWYSGDIASLISSLDMRLQHIGSLFEGDPQ